MEEERNIGSESQEAAKNLLQDESTRNKLLIESLGVSNSLVDTLKEALGINIRRSTEDSNLLNINKRINKAIQGQLGDLTNIDQFQKQIVKNEKLIAEGNTVTVNLSKSLVNNELENSLLNQKKADSVADYIKQIQEAERLASIEQQKLSDNKNLSEEEAKIIATRVRDLKANVNAASALLDKRFESLGILQRQYVVSKLNTEELKKQNNLLKESQKNASGATFLSEVIGKLPGLGSISKKALGEVNEQLVETVANGQKLPSSFKTSSKFVGKLLSGIVDATRGLGLLVVVAKELVDALLKGDKEIVELQKSFALTRFEALGLRNELVNAANETGNINITTTKLLENMSALSKEFGFVARFADDTLATMTKLTTQVGLTAQEAAQLAAAAEISDVAFEDIYKNILGSSYELQQQAGVQFDLREILKATNAVTGQVRANLQANPEAIAKAVTEAKLFGAELDDIVASSKALLQFEDSIRNELQAELLLGRDINLERARSKALLGDQEAVAKELAKQALDFTTFTKLNVLQQDALAASLGMQSDRLSDILFKQEVQNKTARELRALGKEELADRLEAQSAQDKFNAAIEKMKGAFADAVTAFSPILNVLSDVLNLVGFITQALSPIMGLVTGAGAGFLAGGPIGAAIGAVLGGVSDLNRGGAFEMQDGIIPPEGEGSVIQSPRGTFKLPPEDTIIAGTDLFGATPLSQMPDYKQVINDTKLVNPQIRQTTTSTQTVEQNFETFVSRLDKVEAAINNQTKVLAKGQETIAKTKTKLQVGATDFGTELNVNSFRIQ